MTSRRTCPNCGKRRDESHYKLKGNTARGGQVRKWCDPCKRRYYANENMRRRYGITLEDYERMEAAQGHGCAVCGAGIENLPERVGRFHVDHCHETGKVRALLCHWCNLAVGYLRDDPVRALEVAKYLVQSKD